MSMARFVNALLFLICLKFVGSNPERSFEIFNESGGNFEIFWVDPSTKQGVKLSPSSVRDGEKFPLNSFVGHEFEIREVPPTEGGNCSSSPDKVCHVGNFVVSETDNPIVKIRPGIDVILTDVETEAKESGIDKVDRCKAEARRALKNNDSPDSSRRIFERLGACMEESIVDELVAKDREIFFENKVRTDMAGFLENYTCVDDSVPSSPDVSTSIWTAGDNIERTVHVKLNRPASRIHVIENFIDEEECKAMEAQAAQTLHDATVADGKGGHRLSEARKAMQAGIKVDWSKEAEGDPIARLSRRVYDYTENVLGLGIDEKGQEDLMSIQYFGRGRNDTKPDRYTPHCDGDCTGLPHKSGTRMATMVMYCDLPTDGGDTNFRNSYVHVKPQQYNAVFFSYIDPETMLMDRGFTEHSGCPVFEGIKRIVTQWVRLGVDEENPWSSFNTLGIKYSDAADQE